MDDRDEPLIFDICLQLNVILLQVHAMTGALLGVVQLAKATGLPIVPLAFACSTKQLFSSWDHFMVPYPFSRGLFLYGKAMFVSPEGDDLALEAHRLLLETELNRLTDEAERAVTCTADNIT